MPGSGIPRMDRTPGCALWLQQSRRVGQIQPARTAAPCSLSPGHPAGSGREERAGDRPGGSVGSGGRRECGGLMLAGECEKPRILRGRGSLDNVL